MNATFTTVRELNRNGSEIFNTLEKMKNIFIVTKQGKPKCFIAPYDDFSDFQHYKEWKRLQSLSSEEIILEIQSFPLSPHKIPSLEDQLLEV